MSQERYSETDPRIQSALGELQGMIIKRWPSAGFHVSEGDDPPGVYLDATVDIDDPDEVMDLVVERLLDFQVHEGLPVHVVPLQPVERALSATSSRSRRRSYAEMLSGVEASTNSR
ncbi:MAG: hypothetical protein ACYDAG_05565 [Chloroflexota bacterium]